MIKDQDFHEFYYNVLGAKSKITGDLFLSGDAIVTSEIHGTLQMQNEGKLVLERGSLVKGKIKAFDLEIFGTVEGEIECSGLVSIRASAVVTGKIKSGRLVIYPGAILDMSADSSEL